MSRLSDRASPPGYEPVLRLSTRHDDEGGPCVALQVQGRGGDGHELLLLVHGYNNHRLEAEQAYDAFRRHQQPFLDADAARRLHRALGDLFWPADASLPGVLDLLDALAFGQAVQPALFTAGELADHLCAQRAAAAALRGPLAGLQAHPADAGAAGGAQAALQGRQGAADGRGRAGG